MHTGKFGRLGRSEVSHGCTAVFSLLPPACLGAILVQCQNSKRNSFLLQFRPRIRRDYPLNLSILISGGKETNKDSLSNGE